MEFDQQELPYSAEVEVPISYCGKRLNTCFRADFICFDQVVVELKALASLSGAEEAQVINYLQATGLELGLPLNFGAVSLQYRRFVLSPIPSVQSVESVDD